MCKLMHDTVNQASVQGAVREGENNDKSSQLADDIIFLFTAIRSANFAIELSVLRI